MIFFNEIKDKINKRIKTEGIEIVDNSYLHSKHKSFDVNKLHLKLIIRSKKLRDMNKIDAHKEIFSVLKNEMKSKIHALEIEIK